MGDASRRPQRQELHFLGPDADVDLRDLTIDDLRSVHNPVLREVLLAAREELKQQSHSHTNHSNFPQSLVWPDDLPAHAGEIEGSASS